MDMTKELDTESLVEFEQEFPNPVAEYVQKLGALPVLLEQDYMSGDDYPQQLHISD